MKEIDHEPKTQETWSPSVLLAQKPSLEYLNKRTVRPFRALIDLLYCWQLKGNDQEQTWFEAVVVISRHDSTQLWCGENAPQRQR